MMTGMEIWGLDDGWKEIGKVHELCCKRVMRMPATTANGVCARELEKQMSESLDIGKDCGKWVR
jgi:hypothetical protein